MGQPKSSSDRVGRAPLLSPGQSGGLRGERRRFWTPIAASRSSEAAAAEAGVSAPVRVRWFWTAGGMPPTVLAPSTKPLSPWGLLFAEWRELTSCVLKAAASAT